MNQPTFLIIDLFCGAGGTTTGFDMTNGIAKVIACVNHDAKAIESHWKNHPGVVHFEEDIRTLYPREVSGHVVEADHELLASLKSYKTTQTKISELTDQCDALRQEILKCMGEAEQITFNNKVLATWKTSKPARRLDTKALAAAHPDLVEQFMKQGAMSRRFVVKELT